MSTNGGFDNHIRLGNNDYPQPRGSLHRRSARAIRNAAHTAINMWASSVPDIGTPLLPLAEPPTGQIVSSLLLSLISSYLNIAEVLNGRTYLWNFIYYQEWTKEGTVPVVACILVSLAYFSTKSSFHFDELITGFRLFSPKPEANLSKCEKLYKFLGFLAVLSRTWPLIFSLKLSWLAVMSLYYIKQKRYVTAALYNEQLKQQKAFQLAPNMIKLHIEDAPQLAMGFLNRLTNETPQNIISNVDNSSSIHQTKNLCFNSSNTLLNWICGLFPEFPSAYLSNIYAVGGFIWYVLSADALKEMRTFGVIVVALATYIQTVEPLTTAWDTIILLCAYMFGVDARLDTIILFIALNKLSVIIIGFLLHGIAISIWIYHYDPFKKKRPNAQSNNSHGPEKTTLKKCLKILHCVIKFLLKIWFYTISYFRLSPKKTLANRNWPTLDYIKGYIYIVSVEGFFVFLQYSRLSTLQINCKTDECYLSSIASLRLEAFIGYGMSFLLMFVFFFKTFTCVSSSHDSLNIDERQPIDGPKDFHKKYENVEPTFEHSLEVIVPPDRSRLELDSYLKERLEEDFPDNSEIFENKYTVETPISQPRVQLFKSTAPWIMRRAAHHFKSIGNVRNSTQMYLPQVIIQQVPYKITDAQIWAQLGNSKDVWLKSLPDCCVHPARNVLCIFDPVLYPKFGYPLPPKGEKRKFPILDRNQMGSVKLDNDQGVTLEFVVKPYFSVDRCSHCLLTDHTNEAICPHRLLGYPARCGHCAEHHDTSACPDTSRMCCAICKDHANDDFVGHDAFHPDCPYNRKLEDNYFANIESDGTYIHCFLDSN